ncbi:MAG: SOS response-associated peptidase [Pseudomonadota bacterium]
MCSRFALTSPPEAVRATFAHLPTEDFPPRYNIAPTQPIHIVRTSAAGARECVLVRWGLIPRWVKDPAAFTTLINARSETAREKPSFRGAMRHKRCLIPVDAFYEWTGPKGAKRPFMFKAREPGVMAFAGLHEHWMSADGSEMESAAILTTAANGVVLPFHDRMPVLLPQALFDPWLDCKSVDAPEAEEMLQPAPDDLLEAVEVSTALNSPKNTGPDVQTPARTTLL